MLILLKTSLCGTDFPEFLELLRGKKSKPRNFTFQDSFQGKFSYKT